MVSTFDIFKIGIGPSSSHTMGPWCAAEQFVARCRSIHPLNEIMRVQVDLYGSLAKTGKGHGTDVALMLGLSGLDPVTCDPADLHPLARHIQDHRQILLGAAQPIGFDPARDLVFHRDISLPYHPNGLTFTAWLHNDVACVETYYSVGGGFIVQEPIPGETDSSEPQPVPFLINTATDLLVHCRTHGLTIPEVVWQNEHASRSPAQIRTELQQLWAEMSMCAFRGARTKGTLPGGLGVTRRAAMLYQTLLAGMKTPWAIDSPQAWIAAVRSQPASFPEVLKWVSCFALAVNEENASFGRVVTAPTNGAAGVVPAVLLYRLCFHEDDGQAVEAFLLTAGVVGSLFKQGATLSAAMGGCQAEIGVSSAMAAAGLAQTLGGSPEQVLMAAEIAMEHHLGLTCDPVGGLVQVPCIERNSMGAVKAITAAHLALESNPAQARVSLDAVIRSMWATALDMNTKYKETSEGGLAVQIPVNVSEC